MAFAKVGPRTWVCQKCGVQIHSQAKVDSHVCPSRKLAR